MLHGEGSLLEGEIVCTLLYDMFLVEAGVQISAALFGF